MHAPTDKRVYRPEVPELHCEAEEKGGEEAVLGCEAEKKEGGT